MSECTLTSITHAIVEVCTDASARGEQLTGPQIVARILERTPKVQPALIELAFPGAAARLRASAARDFAEADALQRFFNEK